MHNRIAEADLARLEVEDAGRARSSYEAAVEARKLQEESLEAGQAKFDVGASTSFFVIQYESLLAQAPSTEAGATSSYVKARAALERATGSILDARQISPETAVKGGIAGPGVTIAIPAITGWP
ncbi:MAG: TolC family protein [Bryobacteraceae bacterium]